MTHTQDLLSQILVKIQNANSNKRQSLVVFDLDSTLFDISHRTRAIVQEFSAEEELLQKYPDSIEILKKMPVEVTDWGIRASLTRVGLHLHAPEFLQKIRNYWVDRFFHGDYLNHDQPLPGAASYVRALKNLNARIVYLSGRDDQSLREASLRSLKSHHFPDAELVLKPNKGSSDSLFKAHWFSTQKLEDYQEIIFFENEPANILEVEKKFPQVQIIFINSTHSGLNEIQTHWPQIINFSSSGDSWD